MRTLLLELHPTALLEKGLGTLLQQLADGTAARTRIPVVAELSCVRQFPDAVHVALYRIAQEALNNVIKHAQATSAKISLECSGDRTTLVVSDNGRGFDPRTVPAGRLGLGSLRDRARSIGAELEITSDSGQGTQVCVVWRDEMPGESDGR